MNNTSEKEQIVKTLKALKSQMGDINNKQIINRVADLEEDLNNDFFTIVVLGEFKRGKSTFVNALLGEKVLPADVVPTTATINALMWSEEKKTQVLKTSGEVETGESSLDFLNKYTAREDFDVSNIKYLKVGLPSNILENNTVIVDTPGVSDINEHRVQVTYDFIPRADAVIFLLDATSPLKRTEKEFIDEHIIKLGIDRVLFIANKFDYIDEEDEEETLEDIKLRLLKSFNKATEGDSIKELTVLPTSASLALDGAINNDSAKVEASGILEVKKWIKSVETDGCVSGEKNKRYKKRIKDIIESVERETNNAIMLQKTDIETLNEVAKSLDNTLLEEDNRRQKTYSYIKAEEQNILAMMSKSLDYFYSNLQEEIEESIENYRGLEFKDYVERQVPNVIRKNINRWINTYYIHIEKLLTKLEKEVSTGLANYFKKQVLIKSNIELEGASALQKTSIISVEANDISYVTTKAGLISAGAAGAMMLMGASVVMPFVSMAAFPLIQKKMLESELIKGKALAKPVIKKAMDESFEQLEKDITNNISKRVDIIAKSTENIYNQLIQSIKNQINEEIEKKKVDQDYIVEEIEDLENKLMLLKELKNRVS